MHRQHIVLQQNGSKLYAVPSIHFHHSFAMEVNRICADLEERPDAIAVELGPKTAAAAAEFLRDLGVGAGSNTKLPVMLGLSKRNRMIRAAYREKAFQLQRTTGKDLSDLPSKVLHDSLGYCGYEILFLSPTDSIVEALRCALELDLPFFGIDLDETANCNHLFGMVQDSLSIGGNFPQYVKQNAIYAEKGRDPEIDARRERAMAARLKALLDQYRSVLFVSGMAHWPSLQLLLKDIALKPAILPESRENLQKQFKRIIVHPLLAVQYTDRFPSLVRDYQRWRQPADVPGESRKEKRGIYPLAIFDRRLQAVCKSYFQGKARRGQDHIYVRDLRSYRDFLGYLQNLTTLQLQEVPNFHILLKAAMQTMSRQFVQELAQKFMQYPWASPEDFPAYPLVSPASGYDSGHEGEVCLEGNADEKEYFYVGSWAGNGDKIAIDIPFDWHKRKNKDRKVHAISMRHSWPPWDNLLSALSLEAINRAARSLWVMKSELFQGNFLDGIDVRTTLRARLRGKEEMYVRNYVKKAKTNYSGTLYDFPVVWIFRPGNHLNAEWTPLHEPCEWMEKYICNKTRFHDMVGVDGSMMIAVIGYGVNDIQTKATTIDSRIRSDRFHGMIIYQPICWSKRQFSHWVEGSDYQRNPYCKSSLLCQSYDSDLRDLIREKLNIGLNDYDWATTLILFAIPWAQRSVTVVAPDDFILEPVVSTKARQYGVEILRTSLSAFSAKDMERISTCHMAPAKEVDPGMIFSKSILKAMAERPDEYLSRVPDSIRYFGQELY